MTEVMNDTVDVTQPVSVQDDAVQEQASNALEEFMAEGEEQESKPEEQEQQAQTDELPKGIRGRIQAAANKADRSGYERGYREADSAYQARIADYEAKLAKYAEMEIQMEAQELARKEHISLDLAKRVVRAEKGAVKQDIQQETQSSADAPAFNVPQLKSQYEAIRDTYGVDLLQDGVMTSEELDAVVNGYADFNAVALRALPRLAQRQSTPAPVRSSGNHKPAENYDFDKMTDEEFDRFNKKIASGRIYKPR